MGSKPITDPTALVHHHGQGSWRNSTLSPKLVKCVAHCLDFVRVGRRCKAQRETGLPLFFVLLLFPCQGVLTHALNLISFIILSIPLRGHIIYVVLRDMQGPESPLYIYKILTNIILILRLYIHALELGFCDLPLTNLIRCRKSIGLLNASSSLEM